MNYTALADKAQTLIKSKGQTITFTRGGAIEIDPATGEETGSVAQTLTADGVLLNYKKSEIDGSVIQQGDAKIIMAAQGFTPVIGDTVDANGLLWRVMDVMPLSPAAVDVIYTLQVRK